MGTYLAVRIGRVLVSVHGVDVSADEAGVEGGSAGEMPAAVGAAAVNVKPRAGGVPTAGGDDAIGARAYLATCDRTP